MAIWHTRITCRVTKATDIHSEYVILIAFPLQQWLHERASTLRYTYITCCYVLHYILRLSLSLSLSVSSVVFLEYCYFISRFPVAVQDGLRQRCHRITGSTPIRPLMFIHVCWRHLLSSRSTTFQCTIQRVFWPVKNIHCHNIITQSHDTSLWDKTSYSPLPIQSTYLLTYSM